MPNYHTEHQVSLNSANTMALACTATEVVSFSEETQILNFLKAFHTRCQKPNLLVLSGGSNVILPNVLNACVLQPNLKGISLLNEDDNYAYVEVMAGENWHEWVLKSLENNWYGLENMALIPGLVGASPVQNIGAYGVELCDFFETLTAVNLQTGEPKIFSKEDCQFGYRDSIFKQNPNTWLISKVVFKLHKSPELQLNYDLVAKLASEKAQQKTKQGDTIQISPQDVAQAIIEIRQNKLPDPKELPNTGSFFKNPVVTQEVFNKLKQMYPKIPHYPQKNTTVKLPAGWLIDNAGLKGYRIGNIATHEKQALVVVNHAPNHNTAPSSSQDDIARFSQYIQKTVMEKYGIQLEQEPVWVNTNGLFDAHN